MTTPDTVERTLLDGPAHRGESRAAGATPEDRSAPEIDLSQLTGVARTLLTDPRADVGPWTATVVDYEFGSPPTAGLFRLYDQPSRAGTERPRALFLKLLRAYRHWPVFPLLPPDQQALIGASPLWRYEADVYASELGDALPLGLRLPHVHAVLDLGDDFLGLVMEDVETTDKPWDTATFARAAELVGRMAVRLTRTDAAPQTASRTPGEVTRLFEGRLNLEAFPALQSDALWAHPLLSSPAAAALRRDISVLAGRVPAVLGRLELLPQLMIHGDASPQNLLVPRDDPDSFVVIDWTLGGLAAAGDDLGQLFLGLAHAGQLAVDQLPALHDELVRAYTRGARAEGMQVSEAAVRAGLDGGLVLRSAFTALPLQRLVDQSAPVPDDLAELVESRIELSRYLVDVGLAVSA